MKTIAIVMSVNNPEMFSQSDFEKYQTETCYYKLYYADTPLKEINTEEEADSVLPLTVQTIQKAEQEGASAAIVFCFGDIGITEAKEAVQIPVMGAGKMSVQLANELCRNQFTILPGKLVHNQFINAMVSGMNLQKNFKLAEHDVGLLPSEIKDNPDTIDKLFIAACAEIDKNQMDTFTLGCTCFIGLAKPLQEKLRAHYKTNKINVIDPAEVTLAAAKLL